MTTAARILVVDDSPTLRKLVQAILLRNGFESDVAADGVAGLEMLRGGTNYDLVLVDYVMPRMNGYQFCRELRRDTIHREMPVVLMSAKSDRVRNQFVSQTGALDAIGKPFDAGGLIAVIEGALSRSTQGGTRVRKLPDGASMPSSEVFDEDSSISAHPALAQYRFVGELTNFLAQTASGALRTAKVAQSTPEEELNTLLRNAFHPEALQRISELVRKAGFPSVRDEALAGDLESVPLADLLQLLQMQRQTGVLRVSHDETIVSIFIREGMVDLARSRGPVDEFRLGRYFIQKGLCSRTVLTETIGKLRLCPKPRPLLGEFLVSQKIISADDLRDALERQSSELVYELFKWHGGRFWFVREPLGTEAAAAHLALGVSGLVLEGVRRVDEWHLMESTIDFDSVVVIDEMELEAIGQEKLTHLEDLVLRAIDGRRKVREIIRESQVGVFDGAKIIYQFLRSHVLRVRLIPS